MDELGWVGLGGARTVDERDCVYVGYRQRSTGVVWRLLFRSRDLCTYGYATHLLFLILLLLLLRGVVVVLWVCVMTPFLRRVV